MTPQQQQMQMLRERERERQSEWLIFSFLEYFMMPDLVCIVFLYCCYFFLSLFNETVNKTMR